MRKSMCVCAALLTALAVAGCGGGKSQAGNTASNGATGSSKQYADLRWGLLTWPGGIDDLKVIWPQSYEIEGLVAQNLVEAEPDGKPKPGLASSFEQSSPTTYVYHLRSGVRFSDGHPLTSADVVYSLQRNITGKEVWTHGYWINVASVSARGPDTVVIKLKRPNAVWQDVMLFTSPITEKAQLAKIGEKALGTPGNLPIGTGPWKLDAFTPEASAELSPNPYWTGAKQPAKKISITVFKDEASLALALRSGAINGTFGYAAPKTFANISGVPQLKAPGTSETQVVINTAQPPFNNVHVRRAIAYATDTKGIIAALYPGAATEEASIVPSSLFVDLGSTSQVNELIGGLPKYEFNLEKAKQELTKSPYPHGFATTVYAPAPEASLVSAAEILASDLAKIGITAKIHEVQRDEEQPSLYNKTTLFVSTTYSVYPDPEGMTSSLLPPAQIPNPNVAHFNNAEVNKLQTEESETLEPAKRLQLIGKLLGIVGAEVPYVPVFTPDALGSLSSQYVFPTFSNWTILFRPWALDVKLAS